MGQCVCVCVCVCVCCEVGTVTRHCVYCGARGVREWVSVTLTQ